MRKPLLVIGILLLVAGGLIVSGLFTFQTSEKVADLGPIEISKTETRTAPLNLGWALVGAGALATVVGLFAKK
ncbi:MAG TPA: hypothetical protein VK016_07590 [Arenimonas sp.]|nr:hypothetical protein [Arenimonas sp.]